MGKIELINIHKNYVTSDGVLPVLKDISLQVPEHKFISLLGPSGCGKSTLFNIICGLEKADSGSILIDGQVQHKHGQVSYMPQKDLLLPWRSIIDNVTLPLHIAGVNKKQAHQRAMEMLDIFGLEGFENRYPAELSGGMRQRAALMRTVLTDRNIILLDEPFGALDAITRFNMQSWLLEVWDRFQRTILFITHDVEEAVYLSDRIYVLSHRPSYIKLAVDVPLFRPRRPDVVTSAEFVDIKKKILNALA